MLNIDSSRRRVSRYSFLSSGDQNTNQQIIELNPSTRVDSKCHYFGDFYQQEINRYIRNNYNYCVVVEFEFKSENYHSKTPSSSYNIKSICFNIIPLFLHPSSSNNDMSYFYERNKGIIINSEEFQPNEQLLDISYPIHIVSDLKEAIQLLDQHIISHTQSLLSHLNNNNNNKRSFCFLSTTSNINNYTDISLPHILRNILDSIHIENHYLVENTYFINTSIGRPPQFQSSILNNNFPDSHQPFPTANKLLLPSHQQSTSEHNKPNFLPQNYPSGFHTNKKLQLLTTANTNNRGGNILLETITHFKICEKMAQSVDTQQDSSDNNNNTCSTSTANNAEEQVEQDVHSMTLSECLKKPLSIHSPSFEPPLHVLQQTIRQERALFQQVNSPLTDEFKTCVVRLRGLPWTSTVHDIAEFFSEFKLAKKEQSEDGIDLSSEIQLSEQSNCIIENNTSSQLTYAAIVSMGVSNNEQTNNEQMIPQPTKQYKISVDTAKDMDIILMLNYFGKSTGEAYVRFESEEELERARKTMDKKNLGNRYIEIFKSTIEEMEHSRRVLERNLKNLNNSKILKMRNVPFSATEDEIETFFSGLTIATVQSRNQIDQSNETKRRKIYFVLNPMNGKRTGEVFVEFTCHDQMLQAAKRNKEKIRNRYIELFQSSISELRASQYYIQQQNYYSYQHIPRPRMSGVQSRKSNFIVKIEGLPNSFEENEIAELFNGLSLSEAGIHLIFGEDECSTGEAFVEFINEESLARALEKNDTNITSTDENNIEHQNSIKVKASDRAEMLSVCGIEEDEDEEEEEELNSNNMIDKETTPTGLEQNSYHDYSKRRFNYNNFTYPMVYYVPSYAPYYVNTYFQQTQPFRNNLESNTDTNVKPFKYKLFEHPERTLKMRGLPFSSTEKEIAEFFAGYDFEEDSIRFKMDFKRNRQTGICYIRFRTKTEAERAANERNRCNIGDRYIELFTITPKT